MFPTPDEIVYGPRCASTLTRALTSFYAVRQTLAFSHHLLAPDYHDYYQPKQDIVLDESSKAIA